MKQLILALENDISEVEETLSFFLSSSYFPRQNGRHTNPLQASYQRLACMWVGNDNMDPIIKTVLENITSFKVNYLPIYKFIRLIYTKSETLGQPQIAQTLILDSGKSCLKMELRNLENIVKLMTIVFINLSGSYFHFLLPWGNLSKCDMLMQ